MPNRVIKESINESDGLSQCSIFAIDLYKRLITYADDYGRFNADVTIMRARLYPREYEAVTESDIIDGLTELAGVYKVQFYTPQIFNQFGKKGVYGAFPNWSEHQRVRDTKAKCPDPADTGVNDWYLRRFIPLDMKAQILERDGFKCKICGKFVTSCRDAKRFVKLGSGLYHIDHVVPVLQGGRATMENLRLTCPTCNLKRKKTYSAKEILEDTLKIGVSPQPAATCGGMRLESESESESISESESESAWARVCREDKELGEALKAFATMRQRMRKPLTDRAKGMLITELQKYPRHQWVALVDQSIKKGWTSIYPLKGEETKPETSYDLEKAAEKMRYEVPKLRKKEDRG